MFLLCVTVEYLNQGICYHLTKYAIIMAVAFTYISLKIWLAISAHPYEEYNKKRLPKNNGFDQCTNPCISATSKILHMHTILESTHGTAQM